MPHDRRHYYYWICARDAETGKMFLISGGRSEEEARQKGLQSLGSTDFTIRRLPTINLAAASSMIKGDRLARGAGLKKATERLGHDRSLRRRRQSR